jgi:hypothetical protein
MLAPALARAAKTGMLLAAGGRWGDRRRSTTGIQDSASVAALPAGAFVVAWTSEPSPGTDTSYGSIQGQRFVQPPAVPALSNATRFALGAVMLLGAACLLRRRSTRVGVVDFAPDPGGESQG